MCSKFLCALLLGCSTLGVLAQPNAEFRGVWIATVSNIDWPPKPGLDPDSQRASFSRLLDYHAANGINAVVVQIRPSSDAFYPSNLEPWSQWLTGKQGLAPEPFYDPLAFMIEAAHSRGMAFHAWVNPYRAQFYRDPASVSSNHITRMHPEWFISYGDKKYFDPGNPRAQDYVIAVVKEIVTQYPVDAIHFDDYFYPYQIPGQEFADYNSYRLYGKGMSKADWRRSNIDSIICKVNRVIKQCKPGCQFGISPFGVWRTSDRDPENGSNTRGGVSNYDDLYANILLWLKNGWIDYVAPQLYWELENKRNPFETLVDWWNEHSCGRHCYIGLAPYRAGSNMAWRDRTQIPRQIEVVRERENIQGMIFYSSNSLEKNLNGWADSLRDEYFSEPAKIPVMDWLPPLNTSK